MLIGGIPPARMALRSSPPSVGIYLALKKGFEMEYKGIEYLKKKLVIKRSRVNTRYDYYEMKNAVRDYSKIVPEGFEWMAQTLGWCGKAVDSLADRLSFIEFEEKTDNFELNQIFNMNNKDIFFDSAILSALITSCCFVYISKDETGFPRLQVIDGGNATGILDEITGLLTEGYAVLERNTDGKAILEAYFIAGRTDYYSYGKLIESWPNNSPYPLLVPIIHRPDAKRPFGHSRISRACMNIQQSALRTLRRAEVSAEFYSFPQKWVTGLDPDAERMEKWKATMSSFLQFDEDEDGNKPQVGQFTQQSMSPYTEQLRTFASLFAGETGLTLDDLGFVSENPSSSEAIKASHENLRLAARKAQRAFGSGFLNVGYLAACVRDDYPYARQQLYLTNLLWEPIFEPDASMLSLFGDGAIKLNQAVPGYFNKDNLRVITGMKPSTMPAPEVNDDGHSTTAT